ncbi:HEPN domain-containing protein [Lysobacter enzymogenes]|uniref:HEPN domain-containing protein n=1 Tax=Lysobacter enzymogenes TaxID=69 RepID=UPI001115D2BD|nr:HEPN domain-containing protein [Lysobacter enzymogenes]UZW61543.1 HEPN domain-containing protein [Lysobacter enzymogenes]
MTDFTNGTFRGNMERVEHLIGAARQLGRIEGDSTPQVEDVLRAAVVFMHGTLEEVVRSLYLLRLPNASASTLDKIPFAAHNPKHRDKAIKLGELKNFAGLLVDNVIWESINRHVDSMSINNSDMLNSCLQLAGIKTEPLSGHMPELNNLMKRRHKIAHQMDRDNQYDPGQASPIAIDFERVELWKSTLTAFMADLQVRFETDDLP